MADTQSKTTTKNEYLPLYFYDLTPELKKQAREELFEDEDTVSEAVEQLKCLLKCEKDINFELKDEEYVPFLRAGKYNVEKACKLYVKHVSLLRKCSSVYKNFQFSSIMKCLQSNCLCFLPERDADGCLIVILFMSKWDYTAFSMDDIIRSGVAAVMDVLRCPITQITGCKFIIDNANFSMSQLIRIPLYVIKFGADGMQGGIPIRMKGCHMINTGPLYSYIWAVLKPLMSKKLRSRVHIHRHNIKSLHDHFPPSILPEELGGESGPQDNRRWVETLIQSQAYITKYLRKTMGEEQDNN